MQVALASKSQGWSSLTQLIDNGVWESDPSHPSSVSPPPHTKPVTALEPLTYGRRFVDTGNETVDFVVLISADQFCSAKRRDFVQTRALG